MAIVEKIIELISHRIDKSVDRKNEITEMVRETVTECEIYIQDIKNGSDPSRSKQFQLARSWSKISAKTSSIDVSFSDECLEASRMWINTSLDGFDNDKLNDFLHLMLNIFESGRSSGVVYCVSVFD